MLFRISYPARLNSILVLALLEARCTKERAPTQMAVFLARNFILKATMFREVTTVLNGRKHLKMVIRSVPDSA
jgi:hypothetical protein